MNWDFLALLYVPTARSDAYRIGTGYPIGRDRILTARHVVAPNHGGAPIQVFLLRHPGTEPLTADTLWQGEDELDAALLRLREPIAAFPAPTIATGQPRDLDSWASKGFPEAGVTPTADGSHTRNAVGLTGTAYSPGPAATFELAETTGARDRHRWQGASGAPVFIDGCLAGVLVRSPPAFEGDRFVAVSMAALAADSGFCEAAGWSDRGAQLAALRERLRRALEGSEAAVAELAGRLRVDHNATAVATAVTDLDPVALLKKLNSAHHAQWQRATESARAACAVMVRLLDEVLPILFDRQVLRVVAEGGEQPTWLSLPVATETVAEIVLAGFDRRSSDFVPDGSGGFPRGAGFLTVPKGLETGAAEDGFLEVVIEDLARSLAVDHKTDDVLRVVAALREGGSYRRDTLTQDINAALDFFTDADNPERSPRYVVLPAPGGDETRYRRQLGRVQKLFPQLRIVELGGDDRQGERQSFGWPLRRILQRMTGKGAS